jgi:hypothetical protein
MEKFSLFLILNNTLIGLDPINMIHLLVLVIFGSTFNQLICNRDIIIPSLRIDKANSQFFF